MGNKNKNTILLERTNMKNLLMFLQGQIFGWFLLFGSLFMLKLGGENDSFISSFSMKIVFLAALWVVVGSLFDIIKELFYKKEMIITKNNVVIKETFKAPREYEYYELVNIQIDRKQKGRKKYNELKIQLPGFEDKTVSITDMKYDFSPLIQHIIDNSPMAYERIPEYYIQDKNITKRQPFNI